MASGFSPAERNRSPNLVRFNTQIAGHTNAKANSTTGDMFSKARPRPQGRLLNRGMSILGRSGMPESDCVAAPKNNCERNLASPSATTLITTPDTM